MINKTTEGGHAIVSRLAKLRKGIPENTTVKIPDTEENVTLVKLYTDKIIEANNKLMEYIEVNKVDSDTADLIYISMLLSESMRVPKDTNEYYASDWRDVIENLTPYQVYELNGLYAEVQNGSDDELSIMDEEEFNELKKKLEKIHLKELGGELQTILKYFLVQLDLRNLPKVK